MLKIDDFSKKMPNLDIFVKKRLIRVSLLKSKDECRKNIAADHVTRGSFTGSALLFQKIEIFALKMPSGQRVYIGNIPSNARERDLERFFKGYGRLREVVVKNGYGFVEFDDYR